MDEKTKRGRPKAGKNLAFGSRIESIIQEMGLPKWKFAAIIGVHASNVSRWTAGYVPNEFFLEKISRTSARSINWLLSGTEDPVVSDMILTRPPKNISKNHSEFLFEVKKFLKDKGISQREMAEQLGSTTEYICSFLNGKRGGLKLAFRVGKFTNQNMDWVVDDFDAFSNDKVSTEIPRPELPIKCNAKINYNQDMISFSGLLKRSKGCLFQMSLEFRQLLLLWLRFFIPLSIKNRWR